MKLIYRSLNSFEEAEEAAKIEQESLSTAWSAKQIFEIPEYAVYFAAFDGNKLCGTASMYMIASEGQIMNIAVEKDHRRKGIALGLMKLLEQTALKNNCENITLEVAVNNSGAISLYEKCGYSAVGKRSNFYNSTDALIMEKKL